MQRDKQKKSSHAAMRNRQTNDYPNMAIITAVLSSTVILGLPRNTDHTLTETLLYVPTWTPDKVFMLQ